MLFIKYFVNFILLTKCYHYSLWYKTWKYLIKNNQIILIDFDSFKPEEITVVTNIPSSFTVSLIFNYYILKFLKKLVYIWLA